MLGGKSIKFKNSLEAIQFFQASIKYEEKTVASISAHI